jgi:hypothetical protein
MQFDGGHEDDGERASRFDAGEIASCPDLRSERFYMFGAESSGFFSRERIDGVPRYDSRRDAHPGDLRNAWSFKLILRLVPRNAELAQDD